MPRLSTTTSLSSNPHQFVVFYVKCALWIVFLAFTICRAHQTLICRAQSFDNLHFYYMYPKLDGFVCKRATILCMYSAQVVRHTFPFRMVWLFQLHSFKVSIYLFIYLRMCICMYEFISLLHFCHWKRYMSHVLPTAYNCRSDKTFMWRLSPW